MIPHPWHMLALVSGIVLIAAGAAWALPKEPEPAHNTRLERTMPDAPRPYTYPVRSVESQHDGDTAVAVLSLGFDTFRRVTIRLAGLDTPEVTGASKSAGLAVRLYVSNRIAAAKVVLLESHELDKYGRSLGTLWLDGVNLNDELVSRGMALPYDGGNRAGTWTAALLAKAEKAAKQ